MTTISDDDRLIITRAIMNLLDGWNLSNDDIITVLGLTDIRSRHLEHFRNDTAFPDNKDVMLRVEHLAGIADALRTTYPRNAQMATMWMQRPNRRFRNQPPMQMILEGGVNGLVSVRSELDCSYAWERSGSTL